MYNILPRSNSMGSSSWNPKDSLKEKEVTASAQPQRGQAPAQLQPPSLHFESEIQGNMDTCTS